MTDLADQFLKQSEDVYLKDPKFIVEVIQQYFTELNYCMGGIMMNLVDRINELEERLE